MAPLDVDVLLAIVVAVLALSVAAEAQRLRPRALRQWLFPLLFPSRREDYAASGWSFVLARRILLGIGFAWPLISFLRHSPGR